MPKIRTMDAKDELKMGSLLHLAIRNPDGSHALVVTNHGEKQEIQCRLETQALDLELDRDSVATLVW